MTVLIISIIITGIIATGIYYLSKFLRFLWNEEFNNPDGKWGKASAKIDKIISWTFRILMIFLLWWLVFQLIKFLFKIV